MRIELQMSVHCCHQASSGSSQTIGLIWQALASSWMALAFGRAYIIGFLNPEKFFKYNLTHTLPVVHNIQRRICWTSTLVLYLWTNQYFPACFFSLHNVTLPYVCLSVRSSLLSVTLFSQTQVSAFLSKCICNEADIRLGCSLIVQIRKAFAKVTDSFERQWW